MFRILEAQAPAKQTATDTISTLCGRLQSATLLEDRRAAILGLRSFAKQFPASVASGALRNLIDTLRTQKDDPDTIKTVLDTLLMLFDPDPESEEASEDIIMWLADEFSMKQENITALLDLLEQQEFFSRLYSLQLIAAVSKARPERTQECVMTAPLGTTRLVSVLDDGRDAIRTECLLLLTALTPGNTEFQKQVVFESAFERIFRIIEQDGGIADGGGTVQDGLLLLANLLRLNSSNQMDFRETGCPKRVAALLRPVAEPPKPAESEEQSDWNVDQRDRNLWGMLSIISLFLMDKGAVTLRNQGEFWKQGVTHSAVTIAFNPKLDARIQAKALTTAADLVRRNHQLQEQFSQREVVLGSAEPEPLPGGPKTNGHTASQPKNIIQALLDLSLNVSSNWDLELRLAASECIKAYLQGHTQIRQFFLNRACDGHKDGASEQDNVLSIMIEPQDLSRSHDPYRQWLAAVIFLHLIHDDHGLKQRAREVQEGDEAAGEEVVTCIQTLASNLVAQSNRDGDERLIISYLMVLSSWLFEDPDAVDDFLQEGSNLQGLVTAVQRAHHQQPLVAGLASFLLGVIYEFSTKDSPIPRSTIHNVLISKLGRDLYSASLTRLREDPAVRDFEVDPTAEPLFDSTFVEFLKDNFSRVVRAIDREPDLEISVKVGGIEKGVSREQVDSLRSQLEEHGKSLEEALETIQSLERQLGQAQANHRRDRESAEIEVKRITGVNAELQRNHDTEISKLKAASQQNESETRSRHAMEVKSLRDQIGQLQRSNQEELQSVRSSSQKAEAEAKSRYDSTVKRLSEDSQNQLNEQKLKHEAETTKLRDELQKQAAEAIDDAAKERERHDVELKDLKSRLDKAEKNLEKSNRDHSQDLKTAYDEHKETKESLEGRLKRAEERAAEAEKREKEARKGGDGAKSKIDKADKDAKAKIANVEKSAKAKIEVAEKEAKEKEEARAAVQTELDDLLIVLGDIEEKRARDKKKLKELGQEVSDDEDDEDEEEEEEDDDDDNDDDDANKDDEDEDVD